MGLTKPTEQTGSEEVDNDKDVRVSMVRNRKITITNTSIVLAGG